MTQSSLDCGTPDSAMTDEQKNVLLTVYTLLLFLPDLLKSKILLQMTGPTGGGKTFFLEVLGHMLLGSQFHTHSLPENRAEFENRVINSPFVVFDNVNHIEPTIRKAYCASFAPVWKLHAASCTRQRKKCAFARERRQPSAALNQKHRISSIPTVRSSFASRGAKISCLPLI